MDHRKLVFGKTKHPLNILLARTKFCPSDYNYENVFNSFFFIIFERFGILHAFANFKDAFGNFNIYLSLSLKCTNVLSRSYYKKSHILNTFIKGLRYLLYIFTCNTQFNIYHIQHSYFQFN